MTEDAISDVADVLQEITLSVYDGKDHSVPREICAMVILFAACSSRLEDALNRQTVALETVANNIRNR